MQYAFGDSTVAVQRLKVLAEVFAGSTRDFLPDVVFSKPSLAFKNKK